MGVQLGQRAVVMGGGIAGLFAARVLSDFFGEVIVLERDRQLDQPGPRPGVPQDHHTHTLLARGRAILERFYPGFDADLAAFGVPLYTWGIDTRIRTTGGYLKQVDLGVQARGHSRPTLEWAIRCRAQQLPNVNLCGGCRVTGLVVQQQIVRGVTLQTSSTAQPETLLADWVVDASGRQSRTLDWLAELGYPAPPETVVDPLMGYATRWYQLPAGKTLDVPGVLIQPGVQPGLNRGAAGGLIEQDTVLITLLGMNGDYPPTDEAGFADFAHSLPDQTMANWIPQLEPIGPIYSFRALNRLRHLERVGHLPDRLILLGDAVCTLNPVYGQGMTLAALQAEQLQRDLQRATTLDELAQRFHRHLVGVNRIPWLFATSEDRRYPLTIGRSPNVLERLMYGYMALVFKAAAHDTTVARRLIHTIQLIAHPLALAHPRVVLGTLFALGKRAPSTMLPMTTPETTLADDSTKALTPVPTSGRGKVDTSGSP